MFERMEARVRRRAEAIVRARTAQIAAGLADDLPAGVRSVAGAQGVRFSGRALLRRLALEPALRAMLARLK